MLGEGKFCLRAYFSEMVKEGYTSSFQGQKEV